MKLHDDCTLVVIAYVFICRLGPHEEKRALISTVLQRRVSFYNMYRIGGLLRRCGYDKSYDPHLKALWKCQTALSEPISQKEKM
ncbi:4182_t:CDS:2 [Acaulospora morrowiae]|uniref:4182_t:CDS:1 n=1 Tax=Acaulospora morrowiae TaxID=94023 RepID=A0A9N9AF39_9GLOM|nr:4182_t:CDS:2 [Acaulospora morrowiae]